MKNLLHCFMKILRDRKKKFTSDERFVFGLVGQDKRNTLQTEKTAIINRKTRKHIKDLAVDDDLVKYFLLRCPAHFSTLAGTRRIEKIIVLVIESQQLTNGKIF